MIVGTPAAIRHDQRIKRIPEPDVFQKLPAVPLDGASPLRAGRDRADALFERLRAAPSYAPAWEAAKRGEWRRLFHAAEQAVWLLGCVRYPRSRGRGGSAALLRIVGCAVEAGLFHSVRGKPGGMHQSRLIPLAALRAAVARDPAEIEPRDAPPCVKLRTRCDERRELPFDPAHPVAAETRRKLARINEVNGASRITCVPDDPWGQDGACERVLRPVHCAVFSGDFTQNGRLYTDRFGHQQFNTGVRATIQFDGEPAVELDYGGMHPRLLYHVWLDRDYAGDPYALWGAATTPEQRLLAKLLFNAAINARSRWAAIGACQHSACPVTPTRGFKRGKKLAQARKLTAALRESGLRFPQVYDQMLRAHRPVAHLLGADLGVQLMRLDSRIALDVLHHFALQGIPALGVHDSFLVPRTHEEELQDVMADTYQRHAKHRPTIK